MEIINFLPSEALKPYIRYISYVTVENSSNFEKTLAPIVDGCPGIMIRDEKSGMLSIDSQQIPSSILFGQSTKSFEMKLNGSLKMLCVYLQPNAINSLFKLNAEDLTDSCLDLNELLKKKEIIFRIVNSTSVVEKVKLLNEYLLTDLPKYNLQDRYINYAIEKIRSSNGRYSLKQLKVEVNLSERSFERKFKQQVGISAKLFSRICAFQSSFQQFRNKDYEKLTDVALENIYSDQSHFIRSFKEFSGFSPNKFQRNTNLIAENLSEILV